MKAGTTVRLDEDLNGLFETKGTLGVIVNAERIERSTGVYELAVLLVKNENAAYLLGGEKMTPIGYCKDFDTHPHCMPKLRELLAEYPSIITPNGLASEVTIELHDDDCQIVTFTAGFNADGEFYETEPDDNRNSGVTETAMIDGIEMFGDNWRDIECEGRLEDFISRVVFGDEVPGDFLDELVEHVMASA